jgi:hypothetical protein
MKAIKIILPILVVSTIAYFVYNSNKNTKEPEKYKTSDNSNFIKPIDEAIEAIKLKPTFVFCQNDYKNIQFKINETHKIGDFSNNSNDNNQWKQILSKNLYSAYSNKFVEQALYVFNNSKWNESDLSIIRTELASLKNSEFLEQKSAIAASLNKLSLVLKKYDEINNFLIECKIFNYDQYGLENIFPDLSPKISKSKSYLNNNLDNQYVNNCIRLKDELKKIPQVLYNKHVSYLKNKLIHHQNTHTNFPKVKSSQPPYVREVYKPMEIQIGEIDAIYYEASESIVDRDYYDLMHDLKQNYEKAKLYFN